MIKAIVAAAALFIGAQAHAATLLVDTNGELTGATGVGYNGSLYDVAFQDGSCVSLFSGCDEPSDFAFPTYANAFGFAQSLIDQVFVGDFAREPSLTLGCEESTHCSVLIPYLTESDAVFSVIVDNIDGPDINDAGSSRFSDMSDASLATFAVVTPAAPPMPAVPLPAGAVLLVTSLAALGFARRRR